MLLVMKVKDPSVQVSESFNLPIDIVWSALTNHPQMIQWYFDNIPDFKAEVGFETHFKIENEGRTFTHQWIVSEVVENKRLVYRWKYKEYQGDSIVIFELLNLDGLTQLTVTCEVVEDFDDAIPEFRRESCEGGWQYFIQQSLKTYLRK